MKIIVVDDEMDALSVFLKEIIGEEDTEYKFFRDDEESILSYVAGHATDAAFLDINMPKINGVELAEKLLKVSPDMKIIFITGLSVTEKDLPLSVQKNTAGFLYKPYSADALSVLFSRIKEKKRVLRAIMFDTFDCFIENKKVNFSSSKSKELFALLLAYNGKTLTMSDAIFHLWPDRDVEKSKILYRDAVWRLRKTLEDIFIPCVKWGRASMTLDKSFISCDYWDFLLTGEGNYNGDFCRPYEWSVSYLAMLDKIAEKRH